MLIANITGVTSSTQNRVEKSISKLLFKISRTDVSNDVPVTLTELLTVQKVTKSTSSVANICTSMPLGYLAFLNSYLEGSFFARFLPTQAGIRQASGVYFSVDVSFLGGLKLDNDTYLSIDFTNLDPNLNYQIYGLEYLGQSGLFEDPAVYTLLSVPAGERVKAFNTTESDVIAISRSQPFNFVLPSEPQLYFSSFNELERVQMTYSNGAVSSMTPYELAILNIDTNDISLYAVGMPNDPIGDFTVPTFASQIYAIDVEDVVSIEIQKTGINQPIDVILLNYPNQ